MLESFPSLYTIKHIVVYTVKLFKPCILIWTDLSTQISRFILLFFCNFKNIACLWIYFSRTQIQSYGHKIITCEHFIIVRLR